MQSSRPFALLAALVALLTLLGGCATTPKDRASEMPDVLQALPTEVRERLLAGNIAIGDSTDMVYLAWGRPDRKSIITRQDGQTETWIYLGDHSEFVDIAPRWSHAHSWRYDPQRRRHVRVRQVLTFPDTGVYRRTYVRQQVEFRDGAVIEFEVLSP